MPSHSSQYDDERDGSHDSGPLHPSFRPGGNLNRIEISRRAAALPLTLWLLDRTGDNREKSPRLQKEAVSPLDTARNVALSYNMKQISYTKAAIRALRRMPANTAMLIRSKIAAYAKDPASQRNNVGFLKGREGMRLRVGNWRVIMDDQGNVLAVLEIGPRGGIYE